MPSAKEFVAGADIRPVLKAVDTELAERRAKFDVNARYYWGDMPKPLKDDTNNIMFNLHMPAIDNTLAFLFGEMPIIELADRGRLETAEADDTDDELFIKRAFAHNGGASFWSNVAWYGAIVGQPFVKVRRPDDGTEYPRLINVDPRKIVRVWHEDDIDETLGYIIQWMTTESGQTRKHRQDIMRAGKGWVLVDYDEANNGAWSQVGKEEAWDYALPPVASWQHLPKPGAAYGREEIVEHALNDAVNAIASDFKAILRNHAFPKMAAFGVDAGKIQKTAIDRFWTVEDKDARIELLEMQSKLEPVFDGLTMLIDQFNTQVRNVNVRPAELRAISTNFIMRLRYAPMLFKLNTLRRQYADGGLEPITKLMLAIAGRPADVEPEVKWFEPLPVNAIERTQMLQAQIGMGLSRQTALKELGYNPEAERVRRMDDILDDNFDLAGIGTAGVSE